MNYLIKRRSLHSVRYTHHDVNGETSSSDMSSVEQNHSTTTLSAMCAWLPSWAALGSVLGPSSCSAYAEQEQLLASGQPGLRLLTGMALAAVAAARLLVTTPLTAAVAGAAEALLARVALLLTSLGAARRAAR